MGYTANRFLIVHSWDDETIRAAHATAVQVFGDDHKLVGPLMGGIVILGKAARSTRTIPVERLVCTLVERQHDLCAIFDVFVRVLAGLWV